MEDTNQNNSHNNSAEPSELDRARTERDEYLNGWKRAKADLLNYQKDEAKRLEEIARFGSEDILRDVIAVIDSLNLAFQATERSGGKIDQGLTLIKNQLADILKKRGVVQIEVKVGDVYNPMYHEAIGMIQLEDKMKSGTVAEVVENGYTLHNYVLKASRVKVVE